MTTAGTPLATSRCTIWSVCLGVTAQQPPEVCASHKSNYSSWLTAGENSTQSARNFQFARPPRAFLREHILWRRQHRDGPARSQR